MDKFAAVERVRQYYKLVDAGDIPAMLDLFAAEGRYERPGYPPMIGRDQIERFYREDRRISEGLHELDAVLAAGHDVAVRGRFRGLLRDGQQVSLRFADFFVLDMSLRFADRLTYFFAPLV